MNSEKNYTWTVIAVTAAVCFAAASAGSFFFFDQRIFSWLVEHHPTFQKTAVMKAFTQLGKADTVIWLVLCWILIKGVKREALTVFIAMILVLASVLPLKVAVGRERPNYASAKADGKHKMEAYHKQSFPSGDAALAFATAAAIVPYVRKSTRFTAFTAAGLIGALRVISFAHYPSDVLAGAAIGIIGGWAAEKLAVLIMESKINIQKILTQLNGIIGLIILTVIMYFSKKKDFVIFLEFYPAAVIILYVIYRIKQKFLSGEISQKA